MQSVSINNVCSKRTAENFKLLVKGLRSYSTVTETTQLPIKKVRIIMEWSIKWEGELSP